MPEITFQYDPVSYPDAPALVVLHDSALVKSCPLLNNLVANIGIVEDRPGDEPGYLDKRISPQHMDTLNKWSQWMADESSDDESGEDDELQKVINKYLPRTKLTNFEYHLFKKMKMKERLELMAQAHFLGNERFMDHMARFISKYLERKTPEAMRKIFGVNADETGFSKEEEEEWKKKNGWALVGADDNRGEDTEDEEERQLSTNRENNPKE